jgi:hypothetical protein
MKIILAWEKRRKLINQVRKAIKNPKFTFFFFLLLLFILHHIVAPTVEEDTQNNFDPESIVLNGFMFFTDHGLEHSYRCTVGYRMGNNVSVEDYLEENLTEEDLEDNFDSDDRELFNVDGLWILLPNNTPACAEHERVGCQRCFNWGEQIVRNIRNQ